MAERYRIADEPRPGPLSHFAVDPVVPLFAFMFGGAWLAWPWYVINSFIVGSPTRGREVAAVATGLVGSILYVGGLAAAVGEGRLSKGLPLSFLLLGLVTWKLAVTYVIYSLQARTFEIYRYFGGIVNGKLFVLVLLAPFLRERLMAHLPGVVRLVVDR